jgi:hypothetical protein
MDANRYDQFDIGRTAGAGDEDEVTFRFSLSEHLVQVVTQNAGMKYRKMNAREQRHRAWFFRR